MSKRIQMLVAACGVVLAGSALAAAAARAETATGTWVGPRGGTLHWRGDAVPGHYRGALTYTAPDGETYRRITNVNRGPYGVTASRRWVGPNGAAFVRGGVRY
jgi:hypothetical protein